MEYCVFDKILGAVPWQDYPCGGAIVCIDPLDRFGPQTWMVACVDVDGSLLETRGLFRCLDDAKSFADKLDTYACDAPSEL